MMESVDSLLESIKERNNPHFSSQERKKAEQLLHLRENLKSRYPLHYLAVGCIKIREPPITLTDLEGTE